MIQLAGNLTGVQSSHLHGIPALPSEHGSGLASRLYWLHIPKCGTTFLTSLIDVACPSSWKRWNHGLPVEIFSNLQRKETERARFTACNVAGSGLDPAKRASPKISARLDLELRAQCQLSPFFTCDSDIGLPFNVSQINRGWLQHREWADSSGKCSPIPPAHLQQSPFDLSSVVVMVREPLSRLISSFMYSQHDLTVGNASLVKELSQLGPLPQRATFFALHACSMQTRMLAGAVSKRGTKLWDPPAAFEAADAPASLGCTAAGLERGLHMWREQRKRNAPLLTVGRPPTLPSPVALNSTQWARFVAERLQELRSWRAREGARLVPRALVRLRAARFVGVTSEWARSICIFYRAFGVPDQALGQAQLVKLRTQSSPEDVRTAAEVRRVLQEEGLHEDPMDGPVFAEGVRLFEESAIRHRCPTDAPTNPHTGQSESI
jgi:hypothetical protein